MTTPLFEFLHITSGVSQIVISIALMLMGGFAMTRVTKRLKLPNVTAYITAGILMGPYALNLVPDAVIEGMDFIADIALAFIAFSTGEFFRFSTLKKSGAGVIVITVAEACTASAAVFAAAFFGLKLDLNFALVLAALAAATAPASTMMTIRQTHAHGEFVETLLQVVALDDVVGLIAYSIAVSAALARMTGVFRAQDILTPILLNVLALAFGGMFGLFLKWLLHKRSTDNRLIVTVALLFGFCGICALMDVSALLGCMAMATVYINTTEDERLFKQLNYFSPPILLLFFVRSGLNFDLGALVSTPANAGAAPLLTVGVMYFLTRIIGKYAGAFAGCFFAKKSKRVRNYLGLALIPQAGVAIGLAATGARALGGSLGSALETIILASSVLYELIGPACAKLSLYLSHSYGQEWNTAKRTIEQPALSDENEVEKLIRQIQAIQKELPKHENPYYEEEEAYSEAAEEHAAMMGYILAAVPGNRRRAKLWMP